MVLTKTYEILTQKVSIVKIGGKGQRNEPLIGYEYAPPTPGGSYAIYLFKGPQIFRTSPVEEVREIYEGVMIKTRNSIYRIKYLE
jgi:hypothetical protein